MELFDCIHSLDRPKLAKTIARLAQELGKCPKLFIQVNTGAEVQKAGILLKDLETFVLKFGMLQDLSTAIQLETIHFNQQVKLMSGYTKSLKNQKNKSR